MFNYDDENNEIKNEDELSKQNENDDDLMDKEESDDKEVIADKEADEEQEANDENSEPSYDDNNDYQTNDYYETIRKERNEGSYQNNYNQHNNDNQNHSYMSKKSVGLIVALCVVLALICSICVSIVSASIKNQNTVTTTVQTTVNSPETTTSNNNQPINTTKSQATIETTAAVPVSLEDLNITVDDIGGTQLTVKEVYKQVNESVVIIKSVSTTTTALGSGVVVTEDGYILTNYHVSNPSYDSITVEFADGSIENATYLVGDENADVALLKVNKTNCKYSKLANSDQVEVGDVAIVIGNALGRGITLTSGHISALSRTLSIDGKIMTLLQTDAIINSGNSGGGIFNEYGQLVGIVNAKTGGSTVEGTGYAIPINTVLKVIKDLQTFGYVTGKARLGVTMTYLGESILSNYAYIQITKVTEGSSADLAGIKVDDVIYKIGSDTITSGTALNTALAKYEVGDTVEIVVLRPTKPLSDFKTTSWFGQITYNLDAYLNACDQITLQLTFVEFNPN